MQCYKMEQRPGQGRANAMDAECGWHRKGLFGEICGRSMFSIGLDDFGWHDDDDDDYFIYLFHICFICPSEFKSSLHFHLRSCYNVELCPKFLTTSLFTSNPEKNSFYYTFEVEDKRDSLLQPYLCGLYERYLRTFHAEFPLVNAVSSFVHQYE